MLHTIEEIRDCWLRNRSADGSNWEQALKAVYDLGRESIVRDYGEQLAAERSVLYMAVARLGGMVEGKPTSRGNFLQRIDALVSLEAKLSSP